MVSQDGRELLCSCDFPSDLLRCLGEGCGAESAASLFVGLSWEILTDKEFKKHFIEKGFIAHLIVAYEQLSGDTPIVEMCELVKEIMRQPMEDDWVVSVGRLVPMMVDFARIDGMARKAFQALRAFARSHYEATEIVRASPAVVLAVDVMLTENWSPSLFQTALSFVAAIGGNSEIASELYVPVSRFISRASDVKWINWALADINRIVDTMEELVRSPLFVMIVGMVEGDETPWILFVQASVFVARLMCSGQLQLMRIAFRGGLFFRALRALLEVDHVPSKCLAIDAIGTLLMRADEIPDEGWFAALLADKWILEELTTISENDESVEVTTKVRAILQFVRARATQELGIGMAQDLLHELA
jgi:hypothetical protein